MVQGLQAFKLRDKIKQSWRRLLALAIVWVAMLGLSGCVKYDVGITFDGPHRGEMVQQIQISDRLTKFNNSTAQSWLTSLERRARQVGGQTRRNSQQALTVMIPFYNGKDLETKFNQFFQLIASDSLSNSGLAGLPELNSRLKLNQSNFFLWVRNRLIYEIDLRPLGVQSANGNLLVSSGSLLDLEFQVTGPWGVKALQRGEDLLPQAGRSPQKGALWTLEPGKINRVEAVFWMPSPLGIGTVVIVLVVLGGFYLRYRFLPAPQMATPAVNSAVSPSESRSAM